MHFETQDKLLALTQRLYQLGYQRQWQIGDELWYLRKRQPGLYTIEYIFHSRTTGFLFLRRLDKTIRVAIDDEKLLHLPQEEDVERWFKAQSWIDFFTLRTLTDASHEFSFYYHRNVAYRKFHDGDARVVCLQAMVAAYELMNDIISQ